MKHKKTILVAPLNWGLGHATRCMPIINALLKQGAEVIIASDGHSLLLLQEEYPKLQTCLLPSYNIHYQHSNMILNIAPQVPKILQAIQLERKKLASIISQYAIDVVISDNRYGLYNCKTHNILLTHQLNIQIPVWGLRTAISRMNYRLLNNFDECWVPDHKTYPNLSGKLSHPSPIATTRYIGALSRMTKSTTAQKTQEVLVVLSGPEPQRSILERKIISQAKQSNYQFLIVAGQTQSLSKVAVAPNIHRQSYMTSADLAQTMEGSEFIICRSGYSTLMDLVALEAKKVLLIPTPGQTEQEYLAKQFSHTFGYTAQEQKNLDLKILQDLSPSTAFENNKVNYTNSTLLYQQINRILHL